jgi:ring-1,2-phenylacetyl-CoA epoxidase subunit PaaC
MCGNLLLVERPNGDFAHTILRQFLYAAFAQPFWRAMAGAGDATLAAIGGKAEKELAYHLRHCSEWAIRLGDGTAESHRRAQDALDALWPYVGEMFTADAPERALIEAGTVIDPAPLRPAFDAVIDPVLTEATLARPPEGFAQLGGRTGRHSEHLGHLLAEMQILPRTYPGVVW